MLVADVQVARRGPRRADRCRASISTDEASLDVGRVPRSADRSCGSGAGGRLVGTVGGGESNLMGVWDSFPTGICRTPVPGHRLATEVFSLREDECVYGFGEQFGRLDKVGQTIDVDMQGGDGHRHPSGLQERAPSG